MATAMSVDPEAPSACPPTCAARSRQIAAPRRGGGSGAPQLPPDRSACPECATTRATATGRLPASRGAPAQLAVLRARAARSHAAGHRGGARPRIACSAIESGRPRRSSSVVEQGTHKPLVGGSNPPSATNPASGMERPRARVRDLWAVAVPRTSVMLPARPFGGRRPYNRLPDRSTRTAHAEGRSLLNSRFMRNGLVTLVLVVGTAALLYLFLFNDEKVQSIPYSGSDDFLPDGRGRRARRIRSSSAARSSR